MKLLSIIFFISSVLSALSAVAAFLGKAGKNGTKTGIALIIVSGVFGALELTAIWNSPKGMFLILSGVLIINVILTISREEGG